VSAIEPRAAAQTFRSAVDLIAVDVHVMDGRGRTPATLEPDDFQVTLDGRPRRVVSATLTQHGLKALPPFSPLFGQSRPGASDSVTPIPESEGGAPRTFIISLDTSSFRTLDIRPAVLAAQRFVRQVGLQLSRDERSGQMQTAGMSAGRPLEKMRRLPQAARR
jgi:hypothetical protein